VKFRQLGAKLLDTLGYPNSSKLPNVHLCYSRPPIPFSLQG
jgi:hypothetical protein